MHAKLGIVLQRVFFGAIAIAFLVSLFVADFLVSEWASRNSVIGSSLLKFGSIIPLTFIIALTLGVGEMLRLLHAKGLRPFGYTARLLTVLLAALPWLGPAGYLGDSIADQEGLFWSLVGVAGSVLLIGSFCVLRKNPTGTIQDGGATLLIVIYLGFLGSFGLQLRCANSATAHPGLWLLLIVVLVTKCSDIGAYLVGSAIGRHKLIPSVSPGKTIEGAIGGLLGSGLAAVLFAYPYRLTSQGANQPGWMWFWNQLTSAFVDAFTATGSRPLLQAFFFGVILSICAQIGDLFESCFKRDAGIKDSGAVMPHYGGILDLVDSPLFSLPVAWFLLTRVWNIP